MKDKKIPVECYSRTVGYFAAYSHLNPGKKSERDDRIYTPVPNNLKSSHS